MQFHGAPGGRAMFDGLDVPRNELVIRLQPDEAIYMKTNVKRPGLHTQPVQAELDLSYSSRYPATQVTDAYVSCMPPSSTQAPTATHMQTPAATPYTTWYPTATQIMDAFVGSMPHHP